MRRVLAPVSRRIAANRGHNEKTPSLDSSLAGRDLGSWRSSRGARIGSPGGPYNQPGGVRLSGAPLKLLYKITN